MIDRYRIQIIQVALVLASATLVLSCGKKTIKSAVENPETTPTQISYNLKILESTDGKKSYRGETPLMERYELAREPFMEFREGIKIETFDDSLAIEMDLVANYAHRNEVTKIWTAKGNVTGRNLKENRQLFTEELFWDETKKIIYSNVRTKVIDGSSVHSGTGFEADEDFGRWQFRQTIGQIEMESNTRQHGQRQHRDRQSGTSGNST